MGGKNISFDAKIRDAVVDFVTAVKNIIKKQPMTLKIQSKQQYQQLLQLVIQIMISSGKILPINIIGSKISPTLKMLIYKLSQKSLGLKMVKPILAIIALITI